MAAVANVPFAVATKHRLHLECGHYVDVRKRVLSPKSYRCAICKDKRRHFLDRIKATFVIPYKPKVPAEHIKLSFTLMPTGAKFEDIGV